MLCTIKEWRTFHSRTLPLLHITLCREMSAYKNETHFLILILVLYNEYTNLLYYFVHITYVSTNPNNIADTIKLMLTPIFCYRVV